MSNFPPLRYVLARAIMDFHIYPHGRALHWIKWTRLYGVAWNWSLSQLHLWYPMGFWKDKK
jgi:hypothetical protein